MLAIYLFKIDFANADLGSSASSDESSSDAAAVPVAKAATPTERVEKYLKV